MAQRRSRHPQRRGHPSKILVILKAAGGLYRLDKGTAPRSARGSSSSPWRNPDFRERQLRVKPWHFEDGFRFERVKAGREPRCVPLQARNRHKNRKTSWGVWFLHSRGVPAPTNLRRIKLRLNAPT